MLLPCEIMRIEDAFEQCVNAMRYNYSQLSTGKRFEHRVRITQYRAWLRENYPESLCLEEDTSDVV